MSSRKWQKAIEHVKGLSDSLGMPVDEAIVETVAILQLKGLSTTMSCGGHADRITGGPYVIFISPKANMILQKYKGSLEPADTSYKQTMQRALRATIAERAKLYNLLEAFYATRLTGYDQRLCLSMIGRDGFKLSCQGADQAYVYDKQSSDQLLAKNRQEMQAFTQFLKRLYFESTSVTKTSDRS